MEANIVNLDDVMGLHYLSFYVTRPFKSVLQKISFPISQPKHIMGGQKNLLNETVLLSTQNIC